jgi:hypothetical protein
MPRLAGAVQVDENSRPVMEAFPKIAYCKQNISDAGRLLAWTDVQNRIASRKQAVSTRDTWRR